MQFLSKTDWQNGGCFDLLTRIPVRQLSNQAERRKRQKEAEKAKEGNAMYLDRLAPKSPEGGLETCAFSLSLLKDH